MRFHDIQTAVCDALDDECNHELNVLHRHFYVASTAEAQTSLP